MTVPLLELNGLCKTYGSAVAVGGLSMTLNQGEFVSLLGPSGSGKTTTLHMISGLLAPTSGTIRLDGREINRLPAYKRDIGVVFQNYALFPHLTVAGNIAFPLEMRNVARAEIYNRVDRVLQLVDLPGYGPRYPRQLSGGQQQRIALARAIVFEPRLLLMDEPLGALDKRLREKMQLEIKQLHRRLGVAILYVTHDQDEALVMSDRIAVFNAGRIEQIGTPVELYEHPRTRFVAEFIGESNVLEAATSTSVDGTSELRAGPFRLRTLARAPLPPNTRVLLSVRPERVRVRLRPDKTSAVHTVAGSSENEIQAVVIEAVYMGHQRKYLLRSVDNSLSLTALQISSTRGDEFPEGTPVTASWDNQDIILLDGSV